MRAFTISLFALVGQFAGYTGANTVEGRQAAGNCSALELVIARGTSEPSAPYYGIIVGDPLFNATQKLIPGATGYAVNYPASFACNSRPLGSQDVLSHLRASSQACPQQKWVLVGYSQGADVMHYAAPNISTDLFPRIVALIMFGDPGNKGGSAVPAFPGALVQKLKENCAFGDPVCSNGTSLAAHLSYNNKNETYIADSAAYIQKQLQTNGNAGPQLSPNGGSGGSGNTAALSSLGSLLGASTAAACPSSSGSISATSTASVTTTSRMSSSNTGSVAPAQFTGAASRQKPFGFLF